MPIPWQQLDDLPGRVVGDAGENVGQVALWIKAVELGGFYQRVHGGGPLHPVVAPESPDREWLLRVVHGCARVKPDTSCLRAAPGWRP